MRSPDSEKLTPPDLSQPAGCPANPVRGGGFIFAFRYHELHGRVFQPGLAPEVLAGLSLFLAGPRYDYNLTAVQDRHRDICEQHGMREKTPDGQIASYIPLERYVDRRYWPVSYQARHDVYTTPLGRPFVIWCRMWDNFGNRYCDILYKLTETLTLGYRFNTGRVPASDIIIFDRNLRTNIEAAKVADFAWPEQVTTADKDKETTGKRPRKKKKDQVARDDLVDILGIEEAINLHAVDLLALMEVRHFANTGSNKLGDLFDQLPTIAGGAIDNSVAGPDNEGGGPDFTALLRALAYSDAVGKGAKDGGYTSYN